MPELTTTLRDEDPKIRYYAAKALANIGRPARSAHNELERALADEDSDVRYYATKALGNIGPEAKSSIPALNALAERSSDPKTQQAAKDAIEKINTNE